MAGPIKVYEKTDRRLTTVSYQFAMMLVRRGFAVIKDMDHLLHYPNSIVILDDYRKEVYKLLRKKLREVEE